MAPKGVSNRTLLAKKKGIRMGQTIVVSYREDGKGNPTSYEGVLSDRRIGGTDRESYLELKQCLLLGPAKEVIRNEGAKRFIDAFIDDMDVTEPRTTPVPEVSVPGPAMFDPSSTGMAATPDATAMGMQPMGMGMAPMGGMGMNPMGMGMGMNPMGMGMGMGGMGMNPMAMNMMSMGMGMGGMGMNPMAAMGMSMMPMAAMGMRMRMMGANAAGGAADDDGQAADAAAQLAAAGGVSQLGAAASSGDFDVMAALEEIEDGSQVQVSYTHPQLGKTTYRGVLSERYEGASHVQSYIQLTDCQRIGRRGHLREKEASKRLMCAFIDGIKVVEGDQAAGGGRSRSRSRRADRDRA